jgi:tetratricopeptide (TPR) repeat protein
MQKLPKLKFDIYELESEIIGKFEWGNSRRIIFERFYDIEETHDSEDLILELEALIDDDPEFIDAYNSIGFLEIDFSNFGIALDYFNDAYRIGSKLIPRDFSGKIPWGMLENRPLLRSMEGLGLAYLFLDEWENASKIFSKMLHYNPNDNQGIRALAIQSYIAQGKFREIVKIGKSYSADILPDSQYGLVLAYYRLDKLKEAEESLKSALKYHPKVAKELIKKSHKEIRSKIPGSINVGGEDEAYEYWLRNRQYWTDPKLLHFIELGLKKWQKQK